MSRGPGWIQREILGELRASPGGDTLKDCACGRLRLARGVHDMRAISQRLAEKHGKITHCHFQSSKWQAAFSRALRALEKQGMVRVHDLVPIEDMDERTMFRGTRMDLADGTYLARWGRQRRFVSVIYDAQDG